MLRSGKFLRSYVLLHSILSTNSIQNSIPYEKMLEYVAHYLRFKTFRDLGRHLSKDDSEMGGMDRERFIGEEVLKYKGPTHADHPRYKSAAYRFKFKKRKRDSL